MGGYDVETIHEPDAVERHSTRISAAIEEWDRKVHRRMSNWSHGDEWLTEGSPDPTRTAVSPYGRSTEPKSVEAWVPTTGNVNFAYVVNEQETSAVGSDETIIPPEVSKSSHNQAQALFHRLANEWREATLFTSAVDRMVMHRAYQRIIGLGPIAIPLILRELRREPELWFWALNALTGEDVAAGEETVEGAARRWIEWGVSRGYIE
jgi:hypothetical protein